MKIAWLILLVSAMTDFVITAGTSMGTAMVATGSAQFPSHAVILLSTLGGAVSAARTIQQKLVGALDPQANSSSQLRKGTGDGTKTD